MTTLPTRKITLPTQASAISAATRWISPMSALRRVAICPTGMLGVEARRQPLQLAEQRQPHLEQDLGRRARVDQTTHDVEREAAERERRELPMMRTSSGAVAAEQRAVDQQSREIGDVEREQVLTSDSASTSGETPPMRRRRGQRATKILCPATCHALSLRVGGRGTRMTFVMSAPRLIWPR